MDRTDSTTEVSLQEALALPDNVAAALTSTTPRRPSSLLQVQEDGAANTDDNVNYPTGPKLWLTLASVLTACVIYGLDLTVIAVAVPSLTDHFKSIRDIGWYSAV